MPPDVSGVGDRGVVTVGFEEGFGADEPARGVVGAAAASRSASAFAARARFLSCGSPLVRLRHSTLGVRLGGGRLERRVAGVDHATRQCLPLSGQRDELRIVVVLQRLELGDGVGVVERAPRCEGRTTGGLGEVDAGEQVDRRIGVTAVDVGRDRTGPHLPTGRFELGREVGSIGETAVDLGGQRGEIRLERPETPVRGNAAVTGRVQRCIRPGHVLRGCRADIARHAERPRTTGSTRPRRRQRTGARMPEWRGFPRRGGCGLVDVGS